VAVMGCVVNGPGEAREADLGIAGGEKEAVLFRHGEICRKININDVVSELKKEIDLLVKERHEAA
ncbi:MAG: flavodoxin-dependent (E)-4-hydroxy-3-methylbut-2-enyl-diphosphate synthase, partial [Erysipelotrichaceae bacterium]|nr:flavodoxin-dependent (E)-4-hydroxy-3-methylbut-2-enyl-diphosphate synthase [Erysipelotrichaceae bacterium]